MYLPSIVMVGFYFDKRRALATGIATCGSGIGGFVFAPLCKLLIDNYAWQGAQWIVAALVLNGAILGALYRPLTELDMEIYRRKWRQKQGITHGSLRNLEPEVAEHKLGQQQGHVTTDCRMTNSEPYLSVQQNPQPHKHPLFSGKSKFVPEAYKRALTDSWHSLTGLTTSSLVNIPEACSHSNGYGSVRSIKSRALDSLHLDPAQSYSTCISLFKDLLLDLKNTFDFSMLKDPVFDIYGLSCIFCMAGKRLEFFVRPACRL